MVASASLREGYGLTLIEAGACGTPSVARRIPGHVDAVVDGTTGLLADDGPGWPTALVERAHRRRRCASGSGAAASAHTPAASRWERTASQVVLERALRRRGPPTVSRRCGRHRAARSGAASEWPSPRRSCLAAICLRAVAARRARPPQRRHEAVPLPRPRRAAWSGPARCGTPSVGGGAVTHQTIGYLWPMGPFYWLVDAARRPDWAAQRLWIGSIQLFAALGALVLFRTLLPRRHPASVVAALGYGLSPFVLGHVTGQSALLLPVRRLPVDGVDASSAGSTSGTWRWPAALRAASSPPAGRSTAARCSSSCWASVLWVPFGVHTLGRAAAPRRHRAAGPDRVR